MAAQPAPGEGEGSRPVFPPAPCAALLSKILAAVPPASSTLARDMGGRGGR